MDDLIAELEALRDDLRSHERFVIGRPAYATGAVDACYGTASKLDAIIQRAKLQPAARAQEVPCHSCDRPHRLASEYAAHLRDEHKWTVRDAFAHAKHLFERL